MTESNDRLTAYIFPIGVFVALRPSHLREEAQESSEIAITTRAMKMKMVFLDMVSLF